MYVDWEPGLILLDYNCMINHCNICRTSHWRILRRAVECISYSVGRWRMCNPIAPQLSLRQVPLLVVWQLLALSEGTVASNHRFCWSVISNHIHIFFFSLRFCYHYVESNAELPKLLVSDCVGELCHILTQPSPGMDFPLLLDGVISMFLEM